MAAMDLDPRSSKISVWWDMACGLPHGVQPHEVAGSIRSSLAKRGYKGHLIINAYGDSKRVGALAIDAIAATGSCHHHVSEEKSVLTMQLGFMLWALDHAPPAVLLLISNKKDFSGALHGLRFRGFTVLIASSETLADTLAAAASETFSWETMLRSGPASQPAVQPAPSSSRALWSPREKQLLDPRQLVLYTLDSLRVDKLVPSDFNVSARLKYVINKHGLKDVHKEGTPTSAYLTASITAQDIRPCFEDDKRIYLPRGQEQCWPYVDPSFPVNTYPSATWRVLQQYLLTPSGRSEMESSKSRYHAAEVLKNEGPVPLQDMAMGELIHIVQLAVTLRQWIKPHHQSWTPVVVDTAAVQAFEEPGHGHLALCATSTRQAPAQELAGANGKGLTVPVMASVLAHLGPTDLPLARSLAERGAGGSLSAAKVATVPSATLAQFKQWVLRSLQEGSFHSAQDVKASFESEVGVSLDPEALGYASIEHLLEHLHELPPSSTPRTTAAQAADRVARGPATPGFATPISDKRLHRDARALPLRAASPLTPVVTPAAPGAPSPATRDRWRSSPDAAAPRGHLPTAGTPLASHFMFQKAVDAAHRTPAAGVPAYRHPHSGDEAVEGQGPTALHSPSLSPVLHPPSQLSGRKRQDARDAMPGMAAAPAFKADPRRARHLHGHRAPEEVRSDLMKLLHDIFKSPNNSQKGYQLAFLKGDFARRFGYSLDHELLGFQKLKGLLLDFPALVHVTSAPGGHGILFPVAPRLDGSWKENSNYLGPLWNRDHALHSPRPAPEREPAEATPGSTVPITAVPEPSSQRAPPEVPAKPLPVQVAAEPSSKSPFSGVVGKETDSKAVRVEEPDTVPEQGQSNGDGAAAPHVEERAEAGRILVSRGQAESGGSQELVGTPGPEAMSAAESASNDKDSASHALAATVLLSGGSTAEAAGATVAELGSAAVPESAKSASADGEDATSADAGGVPSGLKGTDFEEPVENRVELTAADTASEAEEVQDVEATVLAPPQAEVEHGTPEKNPQGPAI